MSRPLLDLCLLDDNLLTAWLKVKSNEGAPGEDGVTIERFADGIITRLGKLREQVLSGNYKPSPLLRVALPRPGKSPRLLGIPTVRDRVLQSAVASVLQIHLELEFEDESFGYRPGRSVASAIERVIALRQQGFVWLLDADVTKFFDQVDHALLLDKLQICLPDNSCSDLIEQWIKTSIRTQDGYVKPEAGLPQGSPISPLLANLYLDGFDETISSYEQFRLVRYADDFLILTKTQADAERALTIAQTWLVANGLSIQSDKTSITSFEKGFSFLGVSFLGDNQWATDPQAALWVLPPAFRPISEVTQSMKPAFKSYAPKSKVDEAVALL